MKRGDVEACVKDESYQIAGLIYIWNDLPPSSGVDASVWGEYDREVGKAIMAAIFAKLGMKKIGDKQVKLTSGDLERPRRFKAVDEALRR